MSGRSTGARGRPSWWVFAAIAALVLVDVALVAVALSSTRSSVSSSTASSEVLPTLPPTDSVTPSPTPAESPSVAPLSVVLGAVDDEIAYRGTTGACPDAAAQLEVTTDGGASWNSGAPADARSIQSIEADAAQVAVVASDPGTCAPAVHRSFVQGADWQLTDDLAGRWYLEGANVVAPDGVVSAPCVAPVQLAARTTSEAAVLCGDTTVSVTENAGATWSNSAPVPAAASIAARSGDYLIAVAGRDGCAGAQLLTLSAELAPGALGECLPTDAAAGTTVVATSSDGAAWLWAGSVVARTSDGGATWG